MFQTDSERKRLITFAKSGCCWHITTEYAAVPGKGLQKTYEKEEDATGVEDNMTVTTRRLTGGKWKVQTKKYNREAYYKE